MSARATRRIIATLLDEEVEDEDDFKDVWAEAPVGSETKGYFVYFSEPVEFSFLGQGVKKVTKLGPYRNTYQAARKMRFGLMDQPGVTAFVKRETFIKTGEEIATFGESEEDDFGDGDLVKDVTVGGKVKEVDVLNWLDANGMSDIKLVNKGFNFRVFTGRVPSVFDPTISETEFWTKVLLRAGLAQRDFRLNYYAGDPAIVRISIQRDCLTK